MLKQIAILENAEELWCSFRQGDTGAYAVLMRGYYADLFNYGKRFSGDTEIIKDCIQNLFLGLWKNRRTINDTPSVKNYLLKSFRRLVLKEICSKKPHEQYNEVEFNPRYNFIMPVENNIVLQERLTEISYKMRGVINLLTKRQQEILYLRFYMDAGAAEIADITGLNKQSVYNHLHDALKQLQQICTPDYFNV